MIRFCVQAGSVVPWWSTAWIRSPVLQNQKERSLHGSGSSLPACLSAEVLAALMREWLASCPFSAALWLCQATLAQRAQLQVSWCAEVIMSKVLSTRKCETLEPCGRLLDTILTKTKIHVFKCSSLYFQ